MTRRVSVATFLKMFGIGRLETNHSCVSINPKIVQTEITKADSLNGNTQILQLTLHKIDAIANLWWKHSPTVMWSHHQSCDQGCYYWGKRQRRKQEVAGRRWFVFSDNVALARPESQFIKGCVSLQRVESISRQWNCQLRFLQNAAYVVTPRYEVIVSSTPE